MGGTGRGIGEPSPVENGGDSVVGCDHAFTIIYLVDIPMGIGLAAAITNVASHSNHCDIADVGGAAGPYAGAERVVFPPSEAMTCYGCSESGEADVFDRKIIFDAVFGAFAAKSGFFDAAKRRHRIGDKSCVYAGDPVFQIFGHAPRPA